VTRPNLSAVGVRNLDEYATDTLNLHQEEVLP
jgi:hypothetical protein